MPLPDIQLEETVMSGADRGRGNLLGVQPLMRLRDYATEDSLGARLAGYFDAARGLGWLGPRTVAVLPEHIGTWLVAAGEPEALYRARRLDRALAAVALRHPGAFLAAALRVRARDRMKAALFRAKAGAMAAGYTRVFGELAREYGVTIVAGSIVLPAPSVAGGAVTATDGDLFNVAAVFRPDASAHEQLATKHFPTDFEHPFLACPARIDLPVFDTPAGRLAVLVCADAFYPASYAALRDRGIELLAVPSYLETSDVWLRPWPGYNGAPNPSDVDLRHIGRIAERDAWLRYGMAGRLASAGVPYGMNVFLRGNMLDLGSDGAAIMVREGAVVEARRVAGATLANIWL
jgi:predicted amidohydrolase